MEQEFSGPLDDEIAIMRIRYFYEFQDPFLVFCSEETTIRNNSEKSEIESIAYNIGEFRNRLHIYDSDGKILEFHRSIKDGQDIEDARNSGAEHRIDIEFSDDKPLRPGEYRTIRLEYTREIDYYTVDGYYVFFFNLDDAPRVYISIRTAKNFHCERKILILPSDGKKFELRHLKEKDDVVEELFENSTNITIKRPIEDCQLLFAFYYDIGASLKNWLNLGAGFGVITIIIVAMLLYTEPGGCLQTVIPFAGITNAFLLITRGWLFQNRMEQIEKGLCLFNDVCIPYDGLYVKLIWVLIIEIVLAVFCSYLF
jgi:hypothetical protein